MSTSRTLGNYLLNSMIRYLQSIIFTRLSLSLIFLMMIIILRDILMFPISDVGLLGYNLFVMLVLSHQDLMKYVWFCFPLTCGIPGYIMTLSFVLLIIKKRDVLNIKQLLPILIITLLVVFNWCFYGEFKKWPNLLSFLSFIAIFFYFLQINNKYIRKHCLELIKVYTLGVSFTLSVVIYNMITQYGLDAILTGTLRSGALGVMDNDASAMQGHLAVNANTMAYYAISAFSSLLVIVKTHKNMSKIWNFIMVLVLVLGLCSFSRTYIGCIVLILLCYFLLSNFNSKLKFLISSVLLCTLVVIVFPNIFHTLLDSFMGRFDEDNFATAGGRTVIFSRYNELWLSNIFYVIFGVGVWGEVDIWHMHSGFQQLYVSLGIVGILVYFISYVSYFRNNMTSSFILLLPFFVTFIFNQSIQFLAPYSLMLPYIPTLYVVKLVKKSQAINLQINAR